MKSRSVSLAATRSRPRRVVAGIQDGAYGREPAPANRTRYVDAPQQRREFSARPAAAKRSRACCALVTPSSEAMRARQRASISSSLMRRGRRVRARSRNIGSPASSCHRPSDARRSTCRKRRLSALSRPDALDAGQQPAGFHAVTLLQRQPVVAEQERQGRGNLAPDLGLCRPDRHQPFQGGQQVRAVLTRLREKRDHVRDAVAVQYHVRQGGR